MNRLGPVTLLTVLLLLWQLPAAQAAEMQYPLAVAATADGPIYLADRNLPGIWKVEGTKLSLYFQGEKKFRTPLNAVYSVAIDKDGKLLAGCSATRDVYRFEGDKPVPLTKGEIGIPMAIAVTKEGDMLVSDLEIRQIVKVPVAGGKPEKFADVPGCRGLTIDREGRIYAVSNGGADQVLRFSADGKTREVVVAGRPFQFPNNLGVDDEGLVYVVDGYAKSVWKVDAAGKPAKLVTGAPLVSPVGLCRRGENFVVVDPHAKALFELTRDGKLTQVKLEAAP